MRFAKVSMASLALAVIITVFAAPAFAAVGQYELFTVKENDATRTFLLDNDGGVVWEMKAYTNSKEEVKPYFIQIPAFDKEKRLSDWIKDMEEELKPKK